MTESPTKPIFAFLWRPREITVPVVETAGRTSSTAIFDVTADQTADTAKALRAAGAKDIKISAAGLTDPSLQGFLLDSRVDTLWVEYHPALTTCTPGAFLERLRELSARFSCIPISGDLDFLTLALQSDWHPQAIALKGSEASGFVSRETAGVLYATLREMASAPRPKSRA